jgi:hypothetical protein
MKRVLILVLTALAVFGCSKPAEQKPAANSATAANTNSNADPAPVREEKFTGGVDPRADLVSSAQRLQKQPFWTATVTVSELPGENAVMEYAAPDNYRIRKSNEEVIVVAGKAFTKTEGKWQISDEDIAGEIRQQTQNGVDEGIRNLKDVTIVGPEKLDGRETVVYRHKMGESTVKIWVEKESGLQRKNETVLEAAGKTFRQTVIYDYETPVKIEAPKLN